MEFRSQADRCLRHSAPVRYYDRIGLLPKPPRSAVNYRNCGAAELGRLSFVRPARDLGFSLDQVRALLGLSDDLSRDCAGIDRIANEHLREVDRKLADLTALRREHKAVIDSCDGGTVGECRIIEALGPAPARCVISGSRDASTRLS